MQIGDLSPTRTSSEWHDNAVLQGMRILLVSGIMAGGALALWHSGPSSSTEGMITVAPPQTVSGEAQTTATVDRAAPIQVATADPEAPVAIPAPMPAAAADAAPKDMSRAPVAEPPAPPAVDQAAAVLPPAQAAPEPPAPTVPALPADMNMTGAVTQEASAAEPYVPAGSATDAADARIDLNTASFEQLNSLKGAGSIGRAIIRGRPYKSADDLVKKRVLRRATYERIKNQVTVR